MRVKVSNAMKVKKVIFITLPLFHSHSLKDKTMINNMHDDKITKKLMNQNFSNTNFQRKIHMKFH
jgi:hypothetical protein